MKTLYHTRCIESGREMQPRRWPRLWTGQLCGGGELLCFRRHLRRRYHRIHRGSRPHGEGSRQRPRSRTCRQAISGNEEAGRGRRRGSWQCFPRLRVPPHHIHGRSLTRSCVDSIRRELHLPVGKILSVGGRWGNGESSQSGIAAAGHHPCSNQHEHEPCRENQTVSHDSLLWIERQDDRREERPPSAWSLQGAWGRVRENARRAASCNYQFYIPGSVLQVAHYFRCRNRRPGLPATSIASCTPPSASRRDRGGDRCHGPSLGPGGRRRS